MFWHRVATSLLVLCGPALVGYGQASTAASDLSAEATVTSQLAPSIAVLRASLSEVRLDKWKLSGAAREATEANLSSIRRDVDATLPTLLATADVTPHSVADSLPVSRNLNALYEVLLRVTDQAKISAPQPQVAALAQAAASLDGSRRALDDRLESAATAQEQQLRKLQEALNARSVPAVTATPVAVTPRKVSPSTTRTKHKSAVKPAPAPQ